jgi:hypothetical protein
MPGITETEKDNSQVRLSIDMRVNRRLLDKGAMGNWIMKRKRLLQMRSG